VILKAGILTRFWIFLLQNTNH